MSNKCTIKANKKNSNLFDVTFKDLTQGEFLALKHALGYYAACSPVASDLFDFLKNGIAKGPDILKR